MKRLFLLAGVVAAMISCAQSDVYDINESNPDVIAFDISVGQTTKGKVLTQDGLKASGFGLMAYYTGQSYWNDTDAFTPDFMYNQSVTYANQVWSYSPLKYWPNEDNDKVTFFAYAPYEGDTNGVKASHTANDATGRPEIEFTVQDKAVDMIDFVAGQNMNMVRQQDKVTFYLKHQLARATFSAMTKVDNVSYGADKEGDGDSYVVVKSMNILDGDNNLFYTKGVYTFDDETTNDVKTDHSQDGTWDIDTNSAKAYSFESIMGYNNTEEDESALYAAEYKETGVILPIASTYSTLFAEDEYLFLLPPNGADGLDDAAGSIDIEIVYDIVTIDGALALGYSATTSTYTVSIPAGTLAQGKAYNYQLEFDVTEVLVRAEVVDWDDEITSDAGIVDPYDDNVNNPVTSLDLDIDGETTIYAGESTTLIPVVEYTEEGDSDDTLTWSCSLDYISITKNEDGSLEVTGKKAGVTTVTLTSKSGAKASVEITVVASEYSYTTPEGNLEVGDTFEPEADGVEIPADLTITWSSSDAEIVSVDSETGEITAVAAGTATITGTDQYGNVVFEYSVTVVAATVYVDKVEITTGESGTVTEDSDPFTLEYALSPDGINSKYDVLWESTTESVATVDQNGEVTIVGVGQTTITVTITDADGKTYADSYLLTVVEAMSLSISYSIYTEGYAELIGTFPTTIQLVLTKTNIPDDAEIEWASSNEEYATVNSAGQATLLKSTGEDTVTITASYGDVSATFEMQLGEMSVGNGSTGSSKG